MLSDHVLAQLTAIVGASHVSAATVDRITHSFDATQRQCLPDVVIHPATADEISRIVRLANRERIAIVPRGAGSGFTGGSLPVRGGIALVLTRMNRILEIDTDNLIAVVEPGVVTARHAWGKSSTVALRTQSMAAASMNSRVAGMIRPRMMAETARAAPSMDPKAASMVERASGLGSRRRMIRVTMPRVPSEPTNSRVRS